MVNQRTISFYPTLFDSQIIRPEIDNEIDIGKILLTNGDSNVVRNLLLSDVSLNIATNIFIFNPTKQFDKPLLRTKIY